MRRALSTILVLAFAAGRSQAQPTDASTLAEQLFKQGRDLAWAQPVARGVRQVRGEPALRQAARLRAEAGSRARAAAAQDRHRSAGPAAGRLRHETRWHGDRPGSAGRCPVCRRRTARDHRLGARVPGGCRRGSATSGSTRRCCTSTSPRTIAENSRSTSWRQAKVRAIRTAGFSRCSPRVAARWQRLRRSRVRVKDYQYLRLSGRRDSNPRRQPWQGDLGPTILEVSRA